MRRSNSGYDIYEKCENGVIVEIDKGVAIRAVRLGLGDSLIRTLFALPDEADIEAFFEQVDERLLVLLLDLSILGLESSMDFGRARYEVLFQKHQNGLSLVDRMRQVCCIPKTSVTMSADHLVDCLTYCSEFLFLLSDAQEYPLRKDPLFSSRLYHLFGLVSGCAVGEGQAGEWGKLLAEEPGILDLVKRARVAL